MQRRTTFILLLISVVASVGGGVPRAAATTSAVPVAGTWHGSMRWSEDLAAASAPTSVQYCGTTVTQTNVLDWNESVSLSPFDFTLSAFNVTGTTTQATGSLNFTVTSTLPATVNGAQSCPAVSATTTGSFAGSGTTQVTGIPLTNEPYLELADYAAGSGQYPNGGGWGGTLTESSSQINNGAPDTFPDLLWLPELSITVKINPSDSGAWGGSLPGTDPAQKNDTVIDRIEDSGYGTFFFDTPHEFGLNGAAHVSLTGPPTQPPATKITHGPKSKTTSKMAKFSFSSNQKGSTFECSLDKAAMKACTSPHKYTHLKRGKHTFRVYAVNASGLQDPTPAKQSWRIKK